MALQAQQQQLLDSLAQRDREVGGLWACVIGWYWRYWRGTWINAYSWRQVAWSAAALVALQRVQEGTRGQQSVRG